MNETDDGSGRPFGAGWMMAEGNLVADPRNIAKSGGIAVASFRMACNYRTWDGTDGTHYFSVICRGGMADHVLGTFRKGFRANVTGSIEGNWWKDKDDVDHHDVVIKAETVSASCRWDSWTKGSSADSSRDDVTRQDTSSSNVASGDGHEVRRRRRRTDPEPAAAAATNGRGNSRGVASRGDTDDWEDV